MDTRSKMSGTQFLRLEHFLLVWNRWNYFGSGHGARLKGNQRKSSYEDIKWRLHNDQIILSRYNDGKIWG